MSRLASLSVLAGLLVAAWMTFPYGTVPVLLALAYLWRRS